MSIFVEAKLAQNRKGWFLCNLLSADGFDAQSLPDAGLLMMTGEDFALRAYQAEVQAWTAQPGRVLLLLPPFSDDSDQPLFNNKLLDWHLTANTQENIGSVGSLASLLASETELALVGTDGDSLPEHSFENGQLHTRYFRKHTNSGMLVATCLPLWSITLLDHGAVVKSWLRWFIEHAGVAQPVVTKHSTFELSAGDLNLLVCAFGFGASNLERVIESNKKMALFDLQKLMAKERWPLLLEHGYLDKQSLSAKGQEALEGSPYWAYAQALKSQLL
ncbi:hypothetical protein MO867_02270 [Microbulbifer sp. OS29]|uniref:Uncharacterized protein n=1 Tax=Microbulbifer okhotskensis TaxID=2926617 RepID=A0A9X2EJ28_9GAMM|nr:hypothetical protein [Microbulbifer okhotskensis]MCO1333157.1 hypothetical protein [Microbulbifer okhotskensis]